MASLLHNFPNLIRYELVVFLNVYLYANENPRLLSASGVCGIRQRPILADRLQSTTFGTEGLNFCVRDGNRWNPFVIVTGICELPLFRTLTTAQEKEI